MSENKAQRMASLDVETTIKAKQSQRLRWQINDFGGFLNSQAAQLTQYFGPMPDNLNFRLRLRKLDGHLQICAIADEERDRDLGFLKIDIRCGDPRPDEHILYFHQNDNPYLWEPPKSLYTPSSVLVIEMLYENVQVETHFRGTDSKLDTEQTSRNVTPPQSSSAASFEMISGVGSIASDEQNVTNTVPVFRENQARSKLDDANVEMKKESGEDSDDEMETIMKHTPAKKAPSTTSDTSRSGTLVARATAAVRKRPEPVRYVENHLAEEPAQKAQLADIGHDYDSDDSFKLDKSGESDQEDDRFEQESEERTERAKHEEMKETDILKQQLIDPEFPVFIGVSPNPQVEFLQKTFLELHSKLQDRVRWLVSEYLRGKTQISEPVLNLNDEVFEIVGDLQTILNEFETAEVDPEDGEDYREYLKELRSKFPTQSKLNSVVQNLIFGEIRLHFALSADLQQFNNKVHHAREKYTQAKGQHSHQELLKQIKVLEDDVARFESKAQKLMVPEFVEHRTLRTNLNNLLGLVSRRPVDTLSSSSESQNGAVFDCVQETQANANWDKFVDICDNVRENHDEFEMMLDELEIEPGQTVQNLEDNFVWLEAVRDFKVPYVVKLISGARNYCSKELFQSVRRLRRADTFILRMSKRQQKIEARMAALHRNMRELLKGGPSGGLTH